MSDAKVTESEKRKKVDGDGAVTGRKKKSREDNRDSTVGAPEEEVEEFFAILRRIHEAVSYFKKDEAIGDGRKLTDEGSRLRTMLESVGVDEANGVKGEVRRDRVEGVEENLGLDLNAEPGPEF